MQEIDYIFDDPVESMSYTDGNDVRSAGTSTIFPETAPAMNTLVGRTPENIWVFDTADVPVVDPVSGENFTLKGSTYNAFEVASCVAPIVGYRPDATARNGGSIAGLYTADSVFDRPANESFFVLWYQKFTKSASANTWLWGSGGAGATSDFIYCYASTTTGFAALSWRDSVAAVTQTAAWDGITNDACQTFAAGYDHTHASKIIGGCCNTDTVGDFAAGDVNILDKNIVMQNFCVGGRHTDVSPTGSVPYSSVGAISYLSVFRGAQADGWSDDRAAIVNAFHGSLPT